MKRLLRDATVLILAGLLLAGCGSDNDPVDGTINGNIDSGPDANSDAAADTTGDTSNDTGQTHQDATTDGTVDAKPIVSLKLEAEDATLSGAVVATNATGYSGTGFVDYVNPNGDYIEWEANVPDTGDYEISFAYALATGDRPLEIRVNGAVVKSSLPFPSTGSFNQWSQTAALTVPLTSGVNKIRATAIGSSGANVDYMTVASTAPPKPTTNTCDNYGMYEISFKGAANAAPDDVGLTVDLAMPDGKHETVNGFYTGNNEWKARVYCNEMGTWTWKSAAPGNPSLNGSGSFKVVASSLKGKLRAHAKNSMYLMTDNGETFVHINDTAYFLFRKQSTQWKTYVKQAVAHGINSFRVVSFEGDKWDSVFVNGDKNKLAYGDANTVGERLTWLLNNYPNVYVQLIILPDPPGYKKDDVVWHGLSQAQRERLLRNIVAEFAAYPNVFWQIQNDIDYIGHPNNTALANQVGEYLRTHDIFHTLRSTGGVRSQTFQFTKATWPTYIHIETQDTTPEHEIGQYASTGLPVFDGEDRYESHHAPKTPAVFYRRHMWSWLLSGGSASYGGIWAHTRPYDTATFTAAEYPASGLPSGTYKLSGLDDIIYIRKFISDNHLDLGDFSPNDGKVTGPAAPRQCQVMVSADNKTFLIYHPNAAGINQAASIATGTASLTIKNLPSGTYHNKWMKAADGTVQEGSFSHGGGSKAFTAPWAASDVVLLVTP